jgi:hypothetical protein
MHIQAQRVFVDLWAFTDGDTHVVVRSQLLHGTKWLERFRVDTGEVADSCSGSNEPEKTPEWARPYLDAQ